MKKILLFLMILVLIGLPSISFAQESNLQILPDCGADCGWNDLVQLAVNVINFLTIGLAIPLAVIAFVWAGILMVTAGGNEGQIEKAKGIFWNVLKGFLFVLCAWLIVYTITSALLKDDYYENLLGYFSHYLA